MVSLTRKRKLDALDTVPPDDQQQQQQRQQQDQPVAVAVAAVPDPPKPKRPRLALSRTESPHPAPAPAHNYSLHRRTSLPSTLLSADSPVSPAVSPAAAQPVAPPLLPPITRDTLRELDLDAILRNPQLRHDLLFDPGLQFRPTAGRRKQLAADRYWAAVARELDPEPPTPTPRTRPPTPPPWSPRCLAPQPTPDRLTPMLHELVAVLAAVIVPPPLAPDARTLLAHLDPALIAQELRRGLFDPAGLFALVGATLTRHCAPMRDPLVLAMVRAAERTDLPPAPRAVRTIRMCFEVLELMKLDIANHQLQHLRPFLAASTPDFELRTFLAQCQRTGPPHRTRAWLQRFAGTPPPPTTPHTPPPHAHLHHTLIHALTALVFAPARPLPETLALDTARVALLEKDAADLTALYMLLLLWRQLVFARRPRRLDDWEVDRVKREIWEVGPRRIGSCFLEEEAEKGEERERWIHAMQSVALQIALRAESAQPHAQPPAPEALALMRGWIATHLRRASPLAQRLRALLQHEVAQAVVRMTFGAEASTPATTTTTTATTPTPSPPSTPSPPHTPAPPSSAPPSTTEGGMGLEPLQPEIRHLAQRVAKLAGVHVRVYWSLYGAEGFLGGEEEEEGEGVVDTS